MTEIRIRRFEASAWVVIRLPRFVRLIPPVLEGRSKRTNWVAKRLTLVNGQWMVSDRLLAEIWKIDPREINQVADQRGVPGAKIRQVSELLCDLGAGRAQGRSLSLCLHPG